MKAMRLFQYMPIEKNPLRLVDVPKPVPGDGQVRIKINYCGVCHTDLHTVEGDIHPPKLPITPGHQVVGVIDEIGDCVTKVHVGMRVGVPWFYDACGKCEFCQNGQENLCEKARFTGFHVDGGYAEYMLAEENFVLPLPDGISDVQTAPLLCAGIIGYRSLKKSDLAPGETLGLFGFGASAHLAIQVARYWGCDVYVFTRSKIHRQHAEELGAKWVGGAEDNPPIKIDRAIIFAPDGKIVPMALEKLKPSGTLAINAIHMTPIPTFPYELIYGERTLRSVANATYMDGVEFLKIAAKIPIKSTVTLYDLEDANKALDDVKHSRINGEAVLRIGEGN